jgi:hypothetical protein
MYLNVFECYFCLMLTNFDIHFFFFLAFVWVDYKFTSQSIILLCQFYNSTLYFLILGNLKHYIVDTLCRIKQFNTYASWSVTFIYFIIYKLLFYLTPTSHMHNYLLFIFLFIPFCIYKFISSIISLWFVTNLTLILVTEW